MPAVPPGIEPRKTRAGVVSYRVRWRVGGGRTGEPGSATFPRLHEAKTFRAELIANGWRDPRPAPGSPPVPAGLPAEGPTVAAYGRRYIASLTGVGPDWRSSSLRDLERYVAPSPLGALPIAAVDRTAAREWVRALETGDHPWVQVQTRSGRLSPTTVKRLVTQVGGIFNAAVDDDAAGRNPFRKLRTEREDADQHADMLCLSADQWSTLAGRLPAGVARDLATVLVGTGLRWSEATALHAAHVDLTASPPRLHVAQAWKRDASIPGGAFLGPPQSRRSRRTVTFTDAVAAALEPHLGRARADGGLVLRGAQGGRVRSSNFWTRVWQPSIDAALAPVWAAPLPGRPRVHDLRHTHVSWLIAAGRPVASISRRLGHESIQTTRDRYGHLLPEVDRADLDALDGFMPGAR